jgi:hypothetical protein
VVGWNIGARRHHIRPTDRVAARFNIADVASHPTRLTAIVCLVCHSAAPAVVTALACVSSVSLPALKKKTNQRA